MSPRKGSLLSWIAAAGLGWAVALPLAAAEQDHDYPTYERVRYVLLCITQNGGAQALVYQCSCAMDKLAAQFTLDDFVEMQTAQNASTIVGERAGELRDNSEVRAAAKRYREAEQGALRSCGVAPRR